MKILQSRAYFISQIFETSTFSVYLFDLFSKPKRHPHFVSSASRFVEISTIITYSIPRWNSVTS